MKITSLQQKIAEQQTEITQLKAQLENMQLCHQENVDKVFKAHGELLIKEFDKLKAQLESFKGVERLQWFGYAGHFIGGKSCAYHLSTLVDNKYLVSTIGDYYTRTGKRETLGAGKDSWFETMVFECDGIEERGNPRVINWSYIDSERYAESLIAEKGHYVFIEKYKAFLTTKSEVGE